MAGATRYRTHPVVRGFDRAAESYERGRPEYPAEAVRFLGQRLGLGPGRIVIDLGSGTGKFTRALAPLGAARIAVDPIPGMRRVFSRMLPDVPVLPGAAETIPLPDGFADAVVVAQAFHWFRPVPALREIARVLQPGGALGLVWNIRDESVGWSHRFTELLERYRHSERIPRSRDRVWRAAFGGTGSPFGPVHERFFDHAQRAPRAAFIERVLSVSVVAVLPAAERRRVARAVREILDTDPATRGRPILEMPYRTEVYWALRRPGPRS